MRATLHGDASGVLLAPNINHLAAAIRCCSLGFEWLNKISIIDLAETFIAAEHVIPDTILGEIVLVLVLLL